MRIIRITIACALGVVALQAQQPAVASGQLIRHENFDSKYIEARHVDVWLPEGYSPRKKYPVIYMHDGQMLFDSATTWNRQEWGVDETLGRLFAQQKMRRCIVVGIWNTPARRLEYYPAKAFDLVPPVWRDSLRQDLGDPEALPRSDVYLLFLTRELKPFIDSVYATRPDRKNTFIAGSSMGGLISIYAICEYPAVFGGAACLSTHWPGSVARNEPAIAKGFTDYLQGHLPNPATHKIYFDYGTEGLDAWYEPYQKQVDALMRARGYSAKNWMTLRCAGEDHSERAWRKRLAKPLVFLVGK